MKIVKILLSAIFILSLITIILELNGFFSRPNQLCQIINITEDSKREIGGNKILVERLIFNPAINRIKNLLTNGWKITACGGVHAEIELAKETGARFIQFLESEKIPITNVVPYVTMDEKKRFLKTYVLMTKEEEKAKKFNHQPNPFSLDTHYEYILTRRRLVRI